MLNNKSIYKKNLKNMLVNINKNLVVQRKHMAFKSYIP